jgi:4-cresol dehydrogenase (hydroxylating) flavoprotein subunit
MTRQPAPSVSNITGHEQAILGRVAPATVRAVIRLVRGAKKGDALYPVSTGLNFGYGSASPPTPGNTVVDLAALTNIRIDVDPVTGKVHPVAIIGPGVTQGMLYDYLEKHHPQFTFNVTGSARATSIIGNALDRGVGYFGPRKDDLFGLVVVCGSGKLLATGFRRLKHSPLGTSHPYGLGPILDGLFFQSSFGVVISACFRLVPKRPVQVAVSMALKDPSKLSEFIDILAELKREGLIPSVTHIANRARTHATLSYGVTRYLETSCGYGHAAALKEAENVLNIVSPGEWASLGAITGSRAQVNAALGEVKARMRGIARVQAITDKLLDTGYAVTHRARKLAGVARANAAAISAIRPLHTLALGVPTDAAIDNLLWKFGATDLKAAELDKSNCGLLFINPALPLDGAFVERFIDRMQREAAPYDHKLYITINIETPTSLVAVVNLLFERNDPAQVKRAHLCADRLLAVIHEAGLEVYRARADMMGTLAKRDPAYWQLVHQLKLQFDPDNIISPGRYDVA